MRAALPVRGVSVDERDSTLRSTGPGLAWSVGGEECGEKGHRRWSEVEEAGERAGMLRAPHTVVGSGDERERGDGQT